MENTINDVVRFCADMERKAQKEITGKTFCYTVAREQGRAETYHYMAEILSEIADGNVDNANKLIAELWSRG